MLALDDETGRVVVRCTVGLLLVKWAMGRCRCGCGCFCFVVGWKIGEIYVSSSIYTLQPIQAINPSQHKKANNNNEQLTT